VQLCFNLSNGVTDTLEYNSILIYLVQVKSIYTRSSGRKPHLLKQEVHKEGIKKGHCYKLNQRVLIKKRERCEFYLRVANYEFWN
jgi:hypothetical protein